MIHKNLLNNIGTMDNLVEKVVKTEARSLSRNIPKKYTAAQLYSEQVFDVQDEISETLRPVFEKNGIIYIFIVIYTCNNNPRLIILL